MRVVMLGTGLFAEPTFEALLSREGLVAGLFTSPDREAGEARGSTRQTGRGMKVIALERGVPVFQPPSINTPEGEEMLRSLRPDLCVVAAYGQILKPHLLAVPPNGFINVHASLLPKYRGAAPIQWAIRNGDPVTGVTIFRLARGVDTGEILAQEATPIGEMETSGEVEARLAVIGARLALRCVDDIAAGKAVGIPQDDRQATRAPKLKKEDGLIDWSRPAQEVCNFIRAMHPWPTAFTFWLREGSSPMRLILFPALPGQGGTDQPPGSVLGSLDVLKVAAGEGTVVEVREVQPAGKRRMSAAELLRGRRPLPGDRLGPG
jgi:methionyl-tRNA formyltransferase